MILGGGCTLLFVIGGMSWDMFSDLKATFRGIGFMALFSSYLVIPGAVAYLIGRWLKKKGTDDE